MSCPNCGAPYTPGAKFCSECGTALAAACASCGANLNPGAKFCSECGTPTAGVARTGGAAAPGAGSDVVGAVSQPAVPSGPVPVAERRLVSLLFADLVGFTTITEGRDAEETRELLTRYFDLARETITRYGGTVEKFIGDAVMAVWGAPVATENDAERAVRAALELVAAVPSMGPNLQARAGVLTGEAAVTLGATNQGMVAGDLVNTASRLQSVAPAGTVLVGETTERVTNASIAFEPMGEQQLKGKVSPVPAFRAMRVIAERGGRGRSDRLEAPFVGRDDEFRLLKDLLHATGREKRPRLVSITGQAGVGKSRMAWELSKYMDGVAETLYWHAGRSPAYGEGIAFWSLGEMIRSRTGLAETDDEATTRAKVAESVRRWVPDATEQAWIERALLTLLGVDQTPSLPREELFSAWRTFFERIAAAGTVILVFEDLHWADAGLLDFIDHVLDWTRGVPLLLATLARPELLDRRPSWGAGRRNFVGMGLEPLPEPAMRELLAGLVPGLPERVVASIIARADGIPLYAVETVRMLVAEGKLVEAEGAYQPTADLSSMAVPESLQALIAARLDALDAAQRSLVQDAAVLGQSFTVSGLTAVSDLDAAAVEDALRDLVRRELLVRESDPRSPERGQYAFVQALIREVAYSTLARRDRRTRHLAAARYFESLGDEELAGALASHYLSAYRASSGDPEAPALAAQARIALRAAAGRSLAVGSPEQAAEYLLEAVEVTDDPAERADLTERAGVALEVADRGEAAEARLRESVEARKAIGDRAGEARALGLLGQVLIGNGQARAGIALLEPAAAEFAELGDHPALAFIEHQLARGHWLAESSANAIDLADRALGRAERIDDVPLIADALITKGSALVLLGRAYEGLASLQAGQQLAESHGLTATSVRGLLNMSATLSGRDPKAALDYAQRAMAMAMRNGVRSSLATAAGNAFESGVQTGDWDWVMSEAGRLLDEEWEPRSRTALLRGLEEVLAFRGDPELEDLLREHGEFAEASGETQELSNYHAAVAAGAFATGRYAEAAKGWERSGEENGSNTVGDLLRATRATLWAGDRSTAQRLFERVTGLQVHGPYVEAARDELRGGLAALAGRSDEARAAFATPLARFASIGLEFDRALVAVTMLLTLGPDDPAVPAAAAEARATFERLGARPFLALLDGMTGGVTAGADASTSAGASPAAAPGAGVAGSPLTPETAAGLGG